LVAKGHKAFNSFAVFFTVTFRTIAASGTGSRGTGSRGTGSRGTASRGTARNQPITHRPKRMATSDWNLAPKLKTPLFSGV